MKKLLLLLLIVPLALFSQDDIQDSVANTSFVIKNSEVIFSKVYTDDVDNDQLIERLESFLPSIGNFEFKVNTSTPNQYNGSLTGTIVNYRKYGGTLMGANISLNYPIYANVIIQVKENRYRVLITDIVIKGVPNALSPAPIDHHLDNIITVKKRTKFRRGGEAIRTLGYINKHFSDLFNLDTPQSIDDDF